MSNLVNSSIGKKLMMGLAGLFLCMFLLVHLGINLLVLVNDGGVLYGEAVHFMTTNILIKIMEIFLFGGIVLHIIYGVILQIQNLVCASGALCKNQPFANIVLFEIHDSHRCNRICVSGYSLHELLFCETRLGCYTRRR